MWPKYRIEIACALGLGLALTGCRLDMYDQPRCEPLEGTSFFADGRCARQPVAGTVARGTLEEDTAFYQGKDDKGALVDAFPFAMGEAELRRGRERFNVFCSPCHSRLGDGNGMIVRRGYRKPPSYHIDRLIQAPVGHFFDVMTNGFGAMPSYAAQVPARDRWLIAGYIRVLQQSRLATLDDVPAEERQKLEAGRAP